MIKPYTALHVWRLRGCAAVCDRGWLFAECNIYIKYRAVSPDPPITDPRLAPSSPEATAIRYHQQLDTAPLVRVTIVLSACVQRTMHRAHLSRHHECRKCPHPPPPPTHIYLSL